jgi:hypothetical protein
MRAYLSMIHQLVSVGAGACTTENIGQKKTGVSNTQLAGRMRPIGLFKAYLTMISF